MRKRTGVIALAVVSAFGFGGTYAMAANSGIPAIKFIVVTKPLTPTAKAVFVAKDLSIDKGAGTDAADISVNLQATYDNGTDAPVSGEWDAAQGSSNWITNKATVAKYVNKLAPSGGATKVVVVKPGNLVKLVGKSTGDTPMDILSTSSVAGGVANTGYCLDNSGTQNCYCSQFNACVWKSIAAGTGAKLVCKGGVADGGCAALTPASACGPGGGPCLSFVTGAPAGTCGSAKSGGSGGAVVKSLSCGGLNIGNGGSVTPEGPTPGGSENRFNLVGGGPAYTLSGRTSAQTGNTKNCSDTGCKFGSWLPIVGPLSTCVENTFSAPASGSVNSTTGVASINVPLTSAVYLTNNGTQPCPLCVGGTVGVANSGTCDTAWVDAGAFMSPDAGAACTPTDGAGHNYDCRPRVASLAGTIPVNLTPLTTGTASSTAVAGKFCPLQGPTGAFGNGTVDYIEEVGSTTPGLSAVPVPVTIGSTFCIPTTGNAGIDVVAGLPGPGATSLPGTLAILP
jgi:hypothetical protein